MAPKINRNMRFFNMIEIALAMAIIAFGMTSILGLFPVGLNACRNAVAENCAVDSVEQFASYLRSYAGANKTNFETVFGTSAGYYNTTTNPMANAATVTAAMPKTKDFLDAIMTGVPYVATPVYKGWTIYPYDNPITVRNIYFTVLGPGDYFNPASTKFPSTDFSALISVWKSPLKSYVPDTSGTNWIEDVDDTYERGAGLNIEISWPLNVEDYSMRQKRTFYMEIIKPQQ